jgi:hypothetical protein
VYQFPSVPASTPCRERCARTQTYVTVSTLIISSSPLTYEHSRTEFTDDDDDHLCQYIAEVLPEKDEGGRTGHFIYVDLMRRVSAFISSRPLNRLIFPFRRMNSVNTPGHDATLRMDGASGIARTGIDWTKGSLILLRKILLLPTKKGDIGPGDTGGLTRMMN